MIPINEIVCGRNEDVLATFPDVCIDLTVTSPPYDNLRAYKGYDWDFHATVAQLWRVTKPGGVVVWVVADATVNGSESGTSFRQALAFMALGFNLHDTMIYHRIKQPQNGNRYEPEFEYMFVFAKGTVKTFNPIRVPLAESTKQRRKHKYTTTYHRKSSGEYRAQHAPLLYETRVIGNVWHFGTGNGLTSTDTDKAVNRHPAMFPEKLAEDHILSWSNPGDVVLDPFVGSGTTSKMAIRHHRNFIGIDISPEYCELARRRIGAVQETLFDLSAPQEVMT
jgi:DNA modification methylase